MKNALATLEKNPRAAILQLLEHDPRLISKHTMRQYKADVFDFEEWRNGRTITKTLLEAYAAKLQAKGKAPNTISQRLAAIRWYARKMLDKRSQEVQLSKAATWQDFRRLCAGNL